jgi:NAD(P)-dependent dehydrogenase (short-subunit alcohol dehydrogenase family)
MSRLSGKVAIVTGGASGIGEATAHALAKAGAAVAVADINLAGAEAVAQAIRAEGHEAIPLAVDLTDEALVAEMVAATVAQYGRLDILHNNAADRSEFRARDVDVLGADVDVWNRILSVNLIGAMLGCKYAVPRMLEDGGGSIINMSSDAGAASDINRPAYAASKAAINALTRSVATFHGKAGVRCNSVAPGLVITPGVRALMDADIEQRYLAHHLTPFVAAPEMIADVIVFLASDESRFITGQVLPVDGGLLAHLPFFAEDTQIGHN